MFSRFGINKDQLILINKFSRDIYNLVDIQLDTFPFTALTIGFESLNMGIPVITLKGNSYQGRQMSYVNEILSLNEFTVNSIEEYVNKAIYFANNPKSLVNLRASLRNKLNNSEFYNYKGFTKRLEKTYIDLWNKFLNGND